MRISDWSSDVCSSDLNVGEQSARNADGGSDGLACVQGNSGMGGKGIWTRGEGDGADRLAARKPRQPARLLRVVTVKLDRLGSAEARRQEQRAAERSDRKSTRLNSSH